MTRYKFFSMLAIAVLACTGYLQAYADAGSIQQQDTPQVFSAGEEERIQSLEDLSIPEVVIELKDPKISYKRGLSYKAVRAAFSHRHKDAVEYAERYLKEPLIEVVEGRRVTRVKDFNTAKEIFEVFPEESTPLLTSLYQRSDGITRGNIIRASGGIDGGEPIDTMLIEALDDKSVAEEESMEELGEPLRVCDIAYNQLVLRYELRDVLRNIGPGHKIDVRDYHISILKNQLKD